MEGGKTRARALPICNSKKSRSALRVSAFISRNWMLTSTYPASWKVFSARNDGWRQDSVKQEARLRAHPNERPRERTVNWAEDQRKWVDNSRQPLQKRPPGARVGSPRDLTASRLRQLHAAADTISSCENLRHRLLYLPSSFLRPHSQLLKLKSSRRSPGRDSRSCWPRSCING